MEEFDPSKNYAGPGALTFPTDADANYAAYLHDIEYGKMGPKAYYTYNYADDDFLHRLEATKSRYKGSFTTRNAARRIFEAKKRYGKGYIPRPPMGQRSMPPLEPPKKRSKRPRTAFSSVTAPAKTYGYIAAKKRGKSRYKFKKKMVVYGPHRKSYYKRKSHPWKRSYKGRKRYSNKRRRNSYRKSRGAGSAAVSYQEWKGINYYSVQNGAVLNIANPVVNRSVTFGRMFYGCASDMTTMLSNMSITLTKNQYVKVKRFQETYKIGNASLQPVHVTVYKLSMPKETIEIDGLVSNEGGLDERAKNNDEIPLANQVSGQSLCGIPLAILMKWNKYRNGIPASTPDEETTAYSAATWGSTPFLAGFTRPINSTGFKFPGMNKELICSKISVHTLKGGESFTKTLILKNQILHSNDLTQTGRTEFLKRGACCYIFHAVGSLTHSTDTPDDVGRGLIQLDIEIKKYAKIGETFASQNTVSGKTFNVGIFETMGSSVKAGITKTEMSA